MRFGIFSNGQRNNTVAAATYAEDLYEVVVADKLGFEEAWISEHIGLHRIDTLPAPELFICQAAKVTKRIKLGPAVRCLPLYHPIDVATQAAVCDHLTGGRYMFGFGTGGGMSGMEQRGLDRAKRHEMMLESINLVFRCWQETEPFNYEGEFYRGHNIRVLPKPLQKPYMPMAVASHDEAFVNLAAGKGFKMLLSHYDNPAELQEATARFDAAAKAAGRPSGRGDVAVNRAVYVAATNKQARDDLRDDFNRDIANQRKNFPHLLRHFPTASGRIEDVTFDHMVDAGMFLAGDPDTVSAGIQRIYDESGGFGMLNIVLGKDWSTRRKRARSLGLFMDHVAPRFAPLNPD